MMPALLVLGCWLGEELLLCPKVAVIDGQSSPQDCRHSEMRICYVLPKVTISTHKPSSMCCRAAAQTKGTDELLRHVQANARPVIARQIECVLKHWHALELDKSDAEEEEAEIDDQEDDDFQDAHTGVGDGLDEAESIHSWGDDLSVFTATHMACWLLGIGCSASP